MEWTFEENKVFENAIAELDLGSPNVFQEIASRIPGKTIGQIIEHYEALAEDVESIELGLIPLPDYKVIEKDESQRRKNNNSGHHNRKKGVKWTEEEHKKFLTGLDTYGKGDWRSISRNCVITRTSVQVASHAQKHFLRMQKDSNDHQNVKSSASKATSS